MRFLIALSFALVACASGTPKSQDDAGVPPDGAATAAGHTGSSLVPAAIKARSAKYKLVGTLTVGDGRTASQQHTKNGGVVGATQP